MITKEKYLIYMSCGLAHGMVAYFYCNSNHDFNEKFYHPDVSTYLIRGPDSPLRYYEAVEVSKCAKIRNQYNQVPHLTKDTNVKVTNSQ